MAFWSSQTINDSKYFPSAVYAYATLANVYKSEVLQMPVCVCPCLHGSNFHFAIRRSSTTTKFRAIYSIIKRLACVNFVIISSCSPFATGICKHNKNCKRNLFHHRSNAIENPLKKKTNILITSWFFLLLGRYRSISYEHDALLSVFFLYFRCLYG